MTRKGSDLRVSPLGRPHAFSWRWSWRFFVSIEDPPPRLLVNCQQFCLACLIWAGRPLTVSPEFDWNAEIFREFSLLYTDNSQNQRITPPQTDRITLTQLLRFNNHITPLTCYLSSKTNQIKQIRAWLEVDWIKYKISSSKQCDKCLSAHIGW